MTLEGNFDFQINIAERNEIGSKDLYKTVNKDFIENNKGKIKDQTLEFVVKRDKCTKVSEDMSLLRRTISESMKLRQKLKLKELG